MPLILNGYSASIHCEDREMDQYGMRLEDERTVSCWIASEAGKTFTIHFGDESAKTVMSVAVRMDGRSVESKAHVSRPTSTLTGVLVSTNRIRPFLFSPLVLTDDDTLDGAVNEELGTIRILMFRVQAFVYNKDLSTDRRVVDIGTIHEKSKKAGAHAVTFGDALTLEPRYRVEEIGREAEPFATFVFRYRPIELLRANGIVPPVKAPAPAATLTRTKRRLPETRDEKAGASPTTRKRHRVDSAVKSEHTPEDAEGEDAKNLIILEEQLAMMQKRVKEAREAQRSRAIIKREVSPIRLPSSLDGKVIDLTRD
ncbi:hypothetical protein GY45DRAFT_1330167 [Cubamyces sp. BRFM 1775]|nr:hypothetical protein GY45DRAFT_1330167 [Cubamyces sp. BRFM 1775]